MMNVGKAVVVEITLLSATLILVDQELAIVIELAEVVVELSNVNSTAIVVLLTGCVTIVYFNTTVTCQSTTRQHNQTGLVDHVQRFARCHVHCTTIGNDNPTLAAYTLVLGNVPSTSHDYRALVIICHTIGQAFCSNHRNGTTPCAGNLEIENPILVIFPISFMTFRPVALFGSSLCAFLYCEKLQHAVGCGFCNNSIPCGLVVNITYIFPSHICCKPFVVIRIGIIATSIDDIPIPPVQRICVWSAGYSISCLHPYTFNCFMIDRIIIVMINVIARWLLCCIQIVGHPRCIVRLGKFSYCGSSHRTCKCTCCCTEAPVLISSRTATNVTHESLIILSLVKVGLSRCLKIMRAACNSKSCQSNHQILFHSFAFFKDLL